MRTHSGCARRAAARSGRSRCPSRGGTTSWCAPCGRASAAEPRRWCSEAGCRRTSTPQCGRRSRRGTSRGRSSTATSMSALWRRGRRSCAAARSSACTRTRLLTWCRPPRWSSCPRAFRPPVPCSRAPSRPPSTPFGTSHHGSATGSPSSAPGWWAAASHASCVGSRRCRSRSWTSMKAGPTSRPHSASTSPCRPTPPTVATWSCTQAGRPPGSSGRSTCSRPRAPSSSSAGTATARSSFRWVARSTRVASASARVRSEPSHRPAAGVARTTDRLALALDLLRDAAFDALVTGQSRFGELPDVMARLAAGSLPALCHTITYDGE